MSKLDEVMHKSMNKHLLLGNEIKYAGDFYFIVNDITMGQLDIPIEKNINTIYRFFEDGSTIISNVRIIKNLKYFIFGWDQVDSHIYIRNKVDDINEICKIQSLINMSQPDDYKILCGITFEYKGICLVSSSGRCVMLDYRYGDPNWIKWKQFAKLGHSKNSEMYGLYEIGRDNSYELVASMDSELKEVEIIKKDWKSSILIE